MDHFPTKYNTNSKNQNKNKINNLPTGQGGIPQRCFCDCCKFVVLPVPSETEQLRVRNCSPPPHVLLHAPNLGHGSHTVDKIKDEKV